MGDDCEDPEAGGVVGDGKEKAGTELRLIRSGRGRPEAWIGIEFVVSENGPVPSFAGDAGGSSGKTKLGFGSGAKVTEDCEGYKSPPIRLSSSKRLPTRGSGVPAMACTEGQGDWRLCSHNGEFLCVSSHFEL